jgi:hypothetical protein
MRKRQLALFHAEAQLRRSAARKKKRKLPFPPRKGAS